MLFTRLKPLSNYKEIRLFSTRDQALFNWISSQTQFCSEYSLA